jgi:hypothetical protein
MGNPGIDLGEDAGLDDQARIDAGGGAAEVEGGDPVGRALGKVISYMS